MQGRTRSWGSQLQGTFSVPFIHSVN
jgi:hypothetical protein